MEFNGCGRKMLFVKFWKTNFQFSATIESQVFQLNDGFSRALWWEDSKNESSSMFPVVLNIETILHLFVGLLKLRFCDLDLEFRKWVYLPPRWTYVNPKGAWSSIYQSFPTLSWPWAAFSWVGGGCPAWRSTNIQGRKV